MELNKIGQVKTFKKNRRVGRGESSGRGKTSGRGHKGQKARTGKKIRLGFEGGQLPLIKRLPFKRGVGNSLAKENFTITLNHLEVFSAGSTVEEKSLREKGILKKTTRPYSIKLVAKGQISKPLIIKINLTNKAKELIEKVNGKVEWEVKSKAEKKKVTDA